MAKGKSQERTKRESARGQADAKAAEATEATPDANAGGAKRAAAPGSADIRRTYLKSLLGDYLGSHRGAPAVKPKKR
jgi:hypothetical protein